MRVREWFPKCIATKFLTVETVNAVGLPGPGLEALLDRGEWQRRVGPFFLSFMSTGKTRAERMNEMRRAVAILEPRLSEFKAPIAWQLNISCPNVGVRQEEHFDEVIEALKIGSALGIPQMVKFSCYGLDPGMVYEVGNDTNCDGICLSNTIPWDSLPDTKKIGAFGSIVSPLRRRGIDADGGYSGPYLRRLNILFLHLLNSIGFKKPINAGGGITHPYHVVDYARAGASSVFIGTVGTYRPWRVPAITREAYRAFDGE
ncbi:hypothetical protein AUJ44_02895 [Candidatus Nomurabacteria bacterium CG1_02_47_685]|uniref:Dihydroorotate dehydrogenase catalytic domain-containing protein n=1 Tax=Candidatus Nomurabacteria bacterium CG1_02_47_685 TaxID=1805282 RepID=A0A1J4VBU1_9BACT|nr:MAG: hypothetical protein AUJ44_02895 [Candidatus Nomurabacteria bacterium CG1_02_47_685]